MQGSVWQKSIGILTAWLLLLVFARSAHAIPTFSRKYRTSCITCHTIFPQLNNTGEAFRRNGYQFPSGEEALVKDEPIPMGRDAYKDMWPNSIWPSDLPTLPPVFIRAQMRNIFNTDPGPDGIKWNQDFPHELALGGAGTFGQNISAWWEAAIDPGEGEVEIERAFVQFSNLFAWSDEDDEDGMRMGNRWITLPKYALNLRVGKMQPQIVPFIASEHSRLSITDPLLTTEPAGSNAFTFEPAQGAAVELHGILQQRWSYVVGYANGGAVSGAQFDDNNHKDVYFRVARKWFGFPLDGVVGQPEPVKEPAAVRGQNPDPDTGQDYVTAPAGLSHWRALGFETGVFGWWGVARIPFDDGTRRDSFRRIGLDARLQWFDLNVFGAVYLARDNFLGLVDGNDLGHEDYFSYLVAAEYFIKPWWLTFVRYEQIGYGESARTPEEQARLIPGMVFVIRQNMKFQMEFVVDTTGKDTGGPQATDQFLMQLDFAY